VIDVVDDVAVDVVINVVVAVVIDVVVSVVADVVVDVVAVLDVVPIEDKCMRFKIYILMISCSILLFQDLK
jgi:hypothetical protein